VVNDGHTKSSKLERGDLYNGYQEEGCREEEGREEGQEVVFKTKITCSDCNKVLMGETLIASGGKILCRECFENQNSKRN